MPGRKKESEREGGRREEGREKRKAREREREREQPRAVRGAIPLRPGTKTGARVGGTHLKQVTLRES